MDGTSLFDGQAIAAELAGARASGRSMLASSSDSINTYGAITMDDMPLFGFIERAQAFHIGTIDLVERGNPLGALTLLRSYAENLASAYWVDKHPTDFAKLQPGATEGLPMGRVVAEAEKNLPGFRDLYSLWSSAAHPSGAGAFHTLQIGDGGEFTWQSFPRFRATEDALQILNWVEDICRLTTQVISHSFAERTRVRAEVLRNGAED